jgi:hypothetical protein
MLWYFKKGIGLHWGVKYAVKTLFFHSSFQHLFVSLYVVIYFLLFLFLFFFLTSLHFSPQPLFSLYLTTLSLAAIVKCFPQLVITFIVFIFPLIHFSVLMVKFIFSSFLDFCLPFYTFITNKKKVHLSFSSRFVFFYGKRINLHLHFSRKMVGFVPFLLPMELLQHNISFKRMVQTLFVLCM